MIGTGADRTRRRARSRAPSRSRSSRRDPAALQRHRGVDPPRRDHARRLDDPGRRRAADSPRHLAWNGNATIKGAAGAARTITIASDGTLTAATRRVRPAHPRHRHPAHRGQRDVRGQHRRQLRPDRASRNGADIEVGGASGPRSLDLQDDQRSSTATASADSRPARARRRHADQDDRRRTGIADVQIPVENDGTVTAAAGTTTWLSGGSSGSSGQWAPAAGGFVNFAGGTHSVGGSTIAGAGTVYGGYDGRDAPRR